MWQQIQCRIKKRHFAGMKEQKLMDTLLASFSRGPLLCIFIYEKEYFEISPATWGWGFFDQCPRKQSYDSPTYLKFGTGTRKDNTRNTQTILSSLLFYFAQNYTALSNSLVFKQKKIHMINFRVVSFRKQM